MQSEKKQKNHEKNKKKHRKPQKNHEKNMSGNLMKNQPKTGWFLMVQNHVWRYTLVLFYTLATSEKERKCDGKSMQKRPKIH